ncbi:MAG: 30S ribosomal protein S16 [Planctomycetia bacterium]|nr:30S ribosomal protein S16 [Planctomycetia bacterium]
MKMMGRKHRPFFRICAVDSRNPRDGSVIEELGTYDPLVPDVDARVLLNTERVSYWLGVGAKPSVNVNVLIKKYGAQGTHLEAQKAARERLALPKVVPPAPEPVFIPQPKPAEAPRAEAPRAEAKAEEPAAATNGGTQTEAPAAEQAVTEAAPE